MSIAGAGGAQADDAGPPEVSSVLAGQLSSSGIPGGAYVIVGGDGTRAGGAGTTADGRKVSASTPFVIGSTTKSFTALAVLQLVDSGDVNLDTAVREYVPELRLADGALGEPVPPAPSLRTLYLVFDVVTLVLVGAAAAGVARSLRAMGRRGRPSRPAVRWTGVVVRLAVAGLIVTAPFAAYGWAELWTWAPDAVVLATVSLLLALTAGVRTAELVRPRQDPAAFTLGGAPALLPRVPSSRTVPRPVGSADAHAGPTR